MFLMSLIAVSSLVSCNSSSNDYWNASCFVNVQSTSPLTFTSEDGIQFVVADNRVPSYSPSYGDRAIIYFRIMEDANNTSTTRYSVVLYGVDPVSTGSVAVNAQVDDLAEDPVLIYSYANSVYMSTTKRYLNLAVYFHISAESKLSQHTFTLASIDDDDYLPADRPAADEYLYVELRHDAGDDAIAEGVTSQPNAAIWYSFPLDDFDLAGLFNGTKGLMIGMKGFDGKMVYQKIDWPKAN